MRRARSVGKDPHADLAFGGQPGVFHALAVEGGGDVSGGVQGDHAAVAPHLTDLVDDGLRAAEHHEGRLTDKIDAHEWVTMSLNRSAGLISTKLNSGLSFLASVGATAPFIGLLGTVIGIYRALINIGLAGQASIDKVAGPVGEALIMTAFGLVVAIPAVLAYNVLGRMVRQLSEELDGFAHDLHAYVCAPADQPRTQPQAQQAQARTPEAQR